MPFSGHNWWDHDEQEPAPSYLGKLAPWFAPQGEPTPIPRFNKDDPDQMDDAVNRAVGFGSGWGGTRVLGRMGGPRVIEAFNDVTGKTMGKLGYMDAPGKGGILKNIMTYPEARGQGYANEMLDRFSQEMGPNMNNVRMGDITNSPGFWNQLVNKWGTTYPDLVKRISDRLSQTSEQLGW